MSRETENFSMYSLMSTRIRASRSAKRNSARARASSVFPTPVGPLKMNDPMGRRGSLRPARLLRMALEMAVDGFVLAHHPLVDLVLHVNQPIGLGLLEAGDGDPRPTAHDEGHLLLADLGPVLLPLSPPKPPFGPDLVLELPLPVPQFGRPLEILVPDGLFLLFGDLREGLLQVLHLRRRNLAGDPGPGSGLIDDVDGFVREEPIGDVPVREAGRLLQGVIGER